MTPFHARARLVGALLLAAAMVPLAGAQGPDPALPGPSDSRTGCAGRDLTPELEAAGLLREVNAEAAKVPNGEGKLFRIDRPGVEPSFLFGTMHLADPRVLVLPAPAEAAFAGAETLVIETTDILDPARSAAAMFSRPELTTLPAGETLGNLLDSEEEAVVRAALAEKGIPFSAMERLQPWFVGVGLMLPPCEAERSAAGESVLDVDLARRAAEAGKTVAGLESAVEQLEAMASLPIELQVDSLVSTLAFSDRLPDVLETMVVLYLDGRIAAITPTVERAMEIGADGPGEVAAGGYAAFEEAVVTTRNRTMATRVEAILEAGDAFVAVGALHLPGEAGVVELLRTKGWTVTRAD